MKNSQDGKLDIFSKAFWKSQRGQVTFCIGGLLVSAVFLLSQFGVSCASMFPGEKERAALEKELDKLAKEELSLQEKLTAQAALRSAAALKIENAWQAAIHGEPEVELRALLENTAKKLELRLTNISTVRRSNFSKDISLLEVDVALTSDLETLTNFLLAVDALKPELYWKRFDCRSANQFGVPVVAFSGTLRCANDERSIPASVASETTPDESKAVPGDADGKAVETSAAASTEATEASSTASDGADGKGGSK